MNELEKLFKGLADINRLRMLNLLLHGELCGCDIQHVLSTSQPNVSRHLQYLKNSGLVLDRRDGFRIYYRLAEPYTGSRKQLFEYLHQAFKNQEPYRGDTEKLKESISEGACTRSEWRPYGALQGSKSNRSARM
jgi:ArsR family transcriptional regulator, arsenate/arsenite/antimonite-responsive transcriptional repressor